MLLPSVWIFLCFFCYTLDYSRCLCFFDQEFFYFFCSQVIIVFMLFCNFIKCCCKSGRRGVHLPSFCAGHVLSNTFTFYPIMFFFSLFFVFYFVFRWSGAGWGWWLICYGGESGIVVRYGIFCGMWRCTMVGISGGERYVSVYKIVVRYLVCLGCFVMYL